jgi:hypothetical protein
MLKTNRLSHFIGLAPGPEKKIGFEKFWKYHFPPGLEQSIPHPIPSLPISNDWKEAHQKLFFQLRRQIMTLIFFNNAERPFGTF